MEIFSIYIVLYHGKYFRLLTMLATIKRRMPLDTNAILSEFSATRNEILQLNGQIFVAFSSALALNATILGWLFSKEIPADHLYLATVGAFVLLLGNMLSLNRNRLAHRLAYFQRFFIEKKLPEIQWARAYFEYRDIFKDNKTKHHWFVALSERIAECGTALVVSLQILNIVIVIVLAVGSGYPIKMVFPVLLCVVFIIATRLIGRAMIDYKAIEKAMEMAAKKISLKESKGGIG